MKNSKRILSLFSGCGGMDLGFEGDFEILSAFLNTNLHPDWVASQNKDTLLLKKTIFDVVFANDILKEAKAAYVPYFNKRGHSIQSFHTESIVDLVKRHYMGSFSFPDNIDVVIGGFPCQDFSVAGKRKGFDSDKGHHGEKICELDVASVENRGQLYMWMKEVVSIVKPKVFYAENVKGLVSLGNVKNIIENDFKSIDNDGYLILPAKVLNAADYGVPQNRERVIFIGLNKKYLRSDIIHSIESDSISPNIDLYPSPTHYNPKIFTQATTEGLLPYSTCKQAFINLNEPEEEKYDLAQMAYSKAKFCKGYQGNCEVQLDYISPTIRAEHHGNIEYRRLRKEHGGINTQELKQLKERRLTVRECARLQTFPDDYEFVRKGPRANEYNLSASGAYRVIGNAVPPLLAYHLSKRLESLWDTYFTE